MPIKDFDDVFQYIGGFGRYQMVLFAASCLLNVFVVFVLFGQLFMTLTPPHWCHAPPDALALNLTEAELKRLTIPQDNGTFAQCVRYDVDFAQVVAVNGSWPDPHWPTTPCTHGWTYDYSLYYPTITSQLDWVCDEDWRPAMAQSLFFVGSMVGSPSFGYAADRWGRLPIVVVTNVLGAVAGIASAFSSSFAMFVTLRFLVGLTYEQHYIIAYILLLEYVGTQYRTVMANTPVMTFLTLGLCTMPWIAYALADWTWFTVVIHGSQFLAVLFVWIIPESVRWLLGQGQVDKAVEIVKKVAKVNQKTLDNDVLQDFKSYGAALEDTVKSRPRVSPLDLLKTPVLRRRFVVICIMWMVMTVAYDSHTRNAANVGYDVFVSFTISGAVEFPADLLTMFMMEYVGRRHTTAWSLILSGVVAFAISFVPADSTLTILGLAIAGRFMITITMNVGHQYPVEVLPTVARAQGMGTMQTLGFLAAFSSPYIVYLNKYGAGVPYVVLGVITVVGGLVCFLLPETLNQSLPDTLHDGETFFANQPLCYNPCARPQTSYGVEADGTEMSGPVSASQGHGNPAYDHGATE